MQIRPTQPVEVVLKFGETNLSCDLVELSEGEMVLIGTEFIDKGTVVGFKSKYFRGEATIVLVQYNHYQFTYNLAIDKIKYQPGFLVNTKL